MMWGTSVRYPIDEGFAQLAGGSNRLPQRPDFKDPLIANLQGVQLSDVIDEELDRFYAETGPVNMISRVFRRFRPVTH